MQQSVTSLGVWMLEGAPHRQEFLESCAQFVGVCVYAVLAESFDNLRWQLLFFSVASMPKRRGGERHLGEPGPPAKKWKATQLDADLLTAFEAAGGMMIEEVEEAGLTFGDGRTESIFEAPERSRSMETRKKKKRPTAQQKARAARKKEKRNAAKKGVPPDTEVAEAATDPKKIVGSDDFVFEQTVSQQLAELSKVGSQPGLPLKSLKHF